MQRWFISSTCIPLHCGCAGSVGCRNLTERDCNFQILFLLLRVHAYWQMVHNWKMYDAVLSKVLQKQQHARDLAATLHTVTSHSEQRCWSHFYVCVFAHHIVRRSNVVTISHFARSPRRPNRVRCNRWNFQRQPCLRVHRVVWPCRCRHNQSELHFTPLPSF